MGAKETVSVWLFKGLAACQMKDGSGVKSREVVRRRQEECEAAEKTKEGNGTS
jgi:hypothetical protein